MPPEKHALLSASSASRWLKCTAAPRFEEHLPERTSEYAEEGRLAHSICELKTLKKFTVMTSRTYTTRLNKLKKDPLYSEEMDKTSDLYIEHLIEQAMLYAEALPVRKSGNAYTIEVINPVEYASYVEFGHRTRGGDGWVPGQYFLTLSEQDLERLAPGVIERKLEALLREVFNG